MMPGAIRETVSEHRAIWQSKPVLRSIYNDLFRQIERWTVPGPTVELGAGSGNFKEFLPRAFSVDLQPAPWLDAVADAHRLPFRNGSVFNLVLVDVIHHLAEPGRFLGEAQRVLAPSGRLVLVEPAVTPGSFLFYRFLHHERLDFSADPFGAVDEKARRNPYDGNQAVPTLLFGERRDRLAAVAPLLRLRYKGFLSLFAYPLSGGFRRFCLVPRGLVDPLLRLEARLLPALGRWMAFRMCVVLERDPSPEAISP